ncbi:MAG: cell division protein FtsZ, partial [Pseudomonadaceae bacterium]|nr:cell division protein FtsZ [Pseudomonadaceae bacterium]
MAFELVDSSPTASPVIKVIGIGGGGGNAVNHMVSAKIEGVEFICANTDAQALKNVAAKTVIQLGGEITKGLGAGANPEIGRQAALEDRKLIEEVLQGADMLFITAGMGGGTGTGAAPIVAEIAKELGILSVAVVTKPFPFEQRKRMLIAEEGIANLVQHVDSLITIPNERLLSVMGKNTTLLDAFAAANDVLLGAVQGIAELITNPGVINLDFADVRTVMSEMGMAMMGAGSAKGDQRAREAAEQAVCSPLLEDVDLKGARGILVNVIANSEMGLHEFQDVMNVITEFASDDATVIVGTSLDNSLEEELRVTIVATGLAQTKKVEPTSQPVEKAHPQKMARPARPVLKDMTGMDNQNQGVEPRQPKPR